MEEQTFQNYQASRHSYAGLQHSVGNGSCCHGTEMAGVKQEQRSVSPILQAKLIACLLTAGCLPEVRGIELQLQDVFYLFLLFPNVPVVTR